MTSKVPYNHYDICLLRIYPYLNKPTFLQSGKRRGKILGYRLPPVYVCVCVGGHIRPNYMVVVVVVVSEKWALAQSS